MDLDTLTAADLMTTTIESVDPAEDLRTAASRMTSHGIHCLMVKPVKSGQGFGIITCKDIVRILGDAPVAALDELTVAEVMTAPAITISDYTCVSDCIRLMCMMGVRHAFVISGDEPVGLLSFTDVLKVVSEKDSP